MRLERVIALAGATALTFCALGATDALAQQAEPTAAVPAKPMVVVHLDAPQPVSLEVRNGDDDDWEVLCTAPCDRAVPATEVYRVVGPGMRPSNTFHLSPGGRLTLQVEPSSSGGRAGAVVVTVVGAVALVPVAGVTAVLVGGELLGAILGCPLYAAFETDKSLQNAAYTKCLGDIGTFFGQGYAQPYVWIPAVAGVVLLTTGIVWLAKTPHSGVTQAVSTGAITLP
ncbi:MAG TPA: hypothetical protein VIF09_17500, partial [Polyangiaceae bacterium]